MSEDGQLCLNTRVSWTCISVIFSEVCTMHTPPPRVNSGSCNVSSMASGLGQGFSNCLEGL